MTDLESGQGNLYLQRFFDLRCAGDILNAASPINNAAKEITEAYAAIRHIRPFFLAHPMNYDLLDVCAGNALTSIIATHLLPVHEAIAIDKTPRHRPGHQGIRRWQYRQANLFDLEEEYAILPYAMVAVHACGHLAIRTIELFHRWPNARLLVLLPCCRGTIKGHPIPHVFANRVSKYEAWAWSLAELAKGELYIDQYILSPCNAVIVAEKGGTP